MEGIKNKKLKNMKEDWLKIVKSYEEDWMRIAASFLSDEYHQKNAVQDAYIRLTKHADSRIIHEDGTVNRGYVYLTIRSACNNIYNEEKRQIKDADYDTTTLAQPEMTEEELCFQLIMDNVDRYVMTWPWYDRTLFNLYKNTPMSLRGLAKETGISWMSIHGTIKKCKELVREEFREDYEDYKNGEFHLVEAIYYNKN
jgi:RNA polymerase sigma factor (sigma-70 family)